MTDPEMGTLGAVLRSQGDAREDRRRDSGDRADECGNRRGDNRDLLGRPCHGVMTTCMTLPLEGLLRSRPEHSTWWSCCHLPAGLVHRHQQTRPVPRLDDDWL